MKRALFLYAKLNPGLCYIQVRGAALFLFSSFFEELGIV